MKQVRTIIASGMLVTTLAIGGITAAASAATSEPSKQVVWYKDIATTYSARGNNAFDYTELAKQIPEIEPQNRQEILALSDEQINSMTTSELLVTCLDYPLFADCYFYDNEVVGIKKVINHYNGLQELVKRDDIGEVAYEFYSAIDFDKVISTDEYGLLRLEYLTLLISDDRVINNMSTDVRQSLLKKCAQNCITMYEKYNGELDYIQTTRLAGKILYIESEEFAELAESNEVVQYFLETGTIGEYSTEDWNKIVQCVVKYI